MKISEEVIKNLPVGSRLSKAKAYAKSGKVNINSVQYTDELNFSFEAEVEGNLGYYETSLLTIDGKTKKYDCTCLDCTANSFMCKHIMATLLEASKKVYEDMTEYEMIKYLRDKEINEQKMKNEYLANLASQKQLEAKMAKYAKTEKMLNAFYEKLSTTNQDSLTAQNTVVHHVEDGQVKLIPKLKFGKFTDDLILEFQIGVKQLYKLKNLVGFADAVQTESKYRHGAKLDFVHSIKKFDEESQKVIPLILKYAQHISYANEKAQVSYYQSSNILPISGIILDKTAIDEFFDIYKGKNCQIESYNDSMEFKILDKDPEVKIELKKVNNAEYMLKSIGNNLKLLKGKKRNYIFVENCIYICSDEFSNGPLELLLTFSELSTNEFLVSKELLPKLLTIVAPKIKENLEMSKKDREEVEKFIPKELGVKLYLDFDEKANVIADVKFCYDINEYNPYSPKIAAFPTNIIAEKKVQEQFTNTGFEVQEQSERLILKEEENIYEFLSDGINQYMEDYEVLATDNFKTKQIRQPNIGTLGVKIENNLLNINFSKIDIDSADLKEVMQKYKIKKKYHRLKDGSFINLEEDENIEFLNNLTDGMDVDYKNLAKGNIRVPIHRTLYLEKLLNNMTNIEVDKDNEYKKIIGNVENANKNNDIKVPQNLDNTLRYYQKTGFRWLKCLDEYKFGGILADDMGLGKTLQVIALLTLYLESGEDKKTSIVVCPSSLSMNWRNEIKKFSNEISTLVITGKAEERIEAIKKIPKYDVVITSYDLLKRDVEEYEKLEYTFKYIIADEAQYIKNSNTQNATAIKSINAETKFALTGTPIENSVSELWSIFDFCMPGYLFNYAKFKKNYEVPIVKDNDEKAIKKLKMMIQPFILRRMKKEVLTELPDKTITVMTNEMNEEQNKIYLSHLAQAKQEFASELNTNGFEKSRIKILALLTRLRQICCHPGLFIENYNGESSKLNQCIEILHDSIDSGHKVLIFSGFTSMFPYLEAALNKEKIKFFKLTGSTKVDERIKMVDNFNDDPEIKVFLISLKAGGTGLNLTGADVVMHYDPWWNLSAENQATDRTYRIGQKNNVQVYKFITQNSIEEKINELQERKAKLSENLLTEGETFIDKLSKEDIMALFE